MDFRGKVVLITGGGRGLGRAIALEFAGKGASVAVVGRSIEEIERVADQIKSNGGRAIAVQGDLMKHDVPEKITGRVAKEWGSIDILVNNAAVASSQDVENTSISLWDKTINTNLRGTFLMCRAVIPYMKDKGGCIVNVSSTCGKHGLAGMAAYSASKFGVIGLTESIAAENEKIKAFAICPGSIDTRIFNDLFPDESAKSGPEHAARKISQLCSSTDIPSGSSIEID